MFPPPIVRPVVLTSLNTTTYDESLDFYRTVFDALDIEAVRVEDDVRTTMFRDTLCLREAQTGTTNADVIVVVPHTEAILAVLRALGREDVEPETIDGVHRVMIDDPGGNRLWVTTPAPSA